ncbi:MAG TPA: hypothetical protein VL326_00675 [Kofleriaceae bacterium]|nr:hypothetical protein [Kofleriaceae bacterium]
MKRLFVSVSLVALSSCGGPDRWNNNVTTPRATLAEVAAPHVPIVVHTSGGLYRMFLDTGSREAVVASDSAIPLDATSLLDIEAGHYVVTRTGAPKLVIENMTPQHYVDVAPDHKHIALAEEHTIVVASLIDGAVKRYDVPAGAARDQTLGFHWATANTLLFRYDETAELDIATGTITPVAKDDWSSWLVQHSPDVECREHGFVLQERTRKGHQEIVLVPTASTANPEELSSLETRVLVQATDKDGHHGDGAINLGKKNPEPLSLELLLPSCEHFVFSLEGKTYIGNIATGKIAFVGFGWGAVL